MITDNATPDIVIQAVNRARVFSVLQQPIDMAELGETINAAILEFEYSWKIQTDSLTDPLTGLYNRRFIDRELTRILETARRHDHTFALIFGDLNSFKIINDTYGHSLGDLLLKSIATIFTKTCRGSDLICRYGGDEFLILIEEATNAQAKLLIGRLNKALKSLVIPEMSKERFSLSLGNAAFPVDGSTINDVLEVADKRMYKAKKNKPR